MANSLLMKVLRFILFVTVLLTSQYAYSQFTNVGSGSYTNTFPGTDVAGRNSYPPGAPQINGNATGKPVPTNDWWSSLIMNDHVSNLFNYPMTLKTINNGLVVSYIVPPSTPTGSTQPIDDYLPITVGVSGLNATKATVSDYSDWTVTMNWSNGTRQFEATSGIGMPFLYFTKSSSDIAQITITEGSVVIDQEMIIVTNAHHESDFAIYAPTGSTWGKSGNTYTSNLNGQNYWSMAMIPQTASNISAVAQAYKKYAYVFPENTSTAWTYNETSSALTTTFTVTPDVKEGTASTVLQGLLPHQWAHLAPGSPQPNGYSYTSIRGELKTLDGNSFTVENTFKGILPTLPYLNNYSEGFNPAALNDKIAQIENDPLATWTDSYNEGQVMNRLIQTARIADEMGNIQARNKMVSTVKERLEDWLKAQSGEKAFLFYYNNTWSALIGYPAGHGQDNNLNDHHFHWGYFIHAAAFMEQYEPGWSNQWGGMINLLIRDAASHDRNDTQFPFLRNFSPYAGHSWANGFATFPFGNDQESTSESMQFASSLIHWGTITENDAIRDLGIYIYTTEQTAIEEYWFDINNRTFDSNYAYSVASRIWGNGYDNQTFWTSDIAAAYGIEIYPIHGGSLYLGHHKDYAESLWNEMTANTGILSNEENANLWHDTYWKYLAFIDPQAAIDLYDSNPNRSLKFGISDAQTYHWLHAMNALGTVNTTITSDYPIAASFHQNGSNTYVAHNYKNTPITVNFSDGYQLMVPANDMATSKDANATLLLSSNVYEINTNESVHLSASTSESGIIKVEFFNGATKIGEDTTAPYELDWLAPGIGSYEINAIATDNENTQTTSQSIIITVTNDPIVSDGDGDCFETSSEAQIGSFSEGYTVSFETIGNSVTTTFEMLDSDKDADAVFAYLWEESPFSETIMEQVSEKKFSTTLTNQTIGTTLSYACKFAFTGGMAVTKYFSYEVGSEFCISDCNDDEVSTPNSQIINFFSGWSMFSTYMIPNNLDILDILAPLQQNNQIIILKDNSGLAYLPEWNFNAIGNLTIGQGYLIKTSEECSIELYGDYASPEAHTIELNAGWNTIGYLRMEPTDAESVLIDLNSDNNLVIAKDYQGNAFLPEWNFNAIGDMQPGQGYQLKIIEASSLTYPSNNPCDNNE